MAPPARQTKSPGWALTTSPVFMGCRLPSGWNFSEIRNMPLGAGARLLQPYEFEKPGGIADRYLPLKLRLRREQGNQVDQLAILDLPPSFASPEALLDD